MTIRLKTLFFIALGLLVVWFLFLERAILAPFIVAAIVAYIFNPIVNFFSHKIRLPRTLSIVIIYFVIIGIVSILGLALTRRALEESAEFKSAFDTVVETAKSEISTLPDWMRPTLQETLVSLERSKLFAPRSLFALFPEAISRIVSFVLFLFSGFYFLKEGRNMIDKLLQFAPDNYRIELEIVVNKINTVLGGYLRGQLFMLFLVSTILFVVLSILGIKFALILAIFSGLAEIVPIIGPIVATSAGALVAFLGGSTTFFLPPVHLALIVIIVYIAMRQIQDYFVAPYIMGRITKLHPLIILFSAIAGEHLAGILGLILAVPVAASLRILLEYSMDKVKESEQ